MGEGLGGGGSRIVKTIKKTHHVNCVLTRYQSVCVWGGGGKLTKIQM